MGGRPDTCVAPRRETDVVEGSLAPRYRKNVELVRVIMEVMSKSSRS